MRTGRAVAGTIGVFLLAGMASLSEQRVSAQGGATAPPQRVAVTTTQLKPDMITTWRDLVQKEGIPAFKKAGIPWRWVFSGGPLGGQAFTFTTVTPVANFAQYDQPGPFQRAMGQEAATKYNARLASAVVSSHTVIQTLIADASMQSFSSTPPTLARVATMQLLPGKGPEFTAITASEFLPAFKKAGVADYLVFVKAMGQEAFQKLNQKRAALTNGAEAIVLRYVPELSYGVPTKPGSSTQ